MAAAPLKPAPAGRGLPEIGRMANLAVIPTGAERSEAKWRDLFCRCIVKNRSLDYATLRVAPLAMTVTAAHPSGARPGGRRTGASWRGPCGLAGTRRGWESAAS